MRFGIGMNTDHTLEEVGQQFFGDPRAHSPDRGEGPAQAQASVALAQAAQLPRQLIRGEGAAMAAASGDEANEPRGELTVRTIAMPADTNANGDIFGGWVLSQMDQAGGIAGVERARGRVVTIRRRGDDLHPPGPRRGRPLRLYRDRIGGADLDEDPHRGLGSALPEAMLARR